jgi:hypothetical protein
MKELFNILCSKDLEYASRFANIVTSRWLFLFMSSNLSNETKILAVQMFGTLWLTQESVYNTVKFKEGFNILSNCLAASHETIEIYGALYAMFCGNLFSIINNANTSSLDISMTKMISQAKKPFISIEIIKIITRMMAACAKKLCQLDALISSNDVTEDVKTNLKGLFGICFMNYLFNQRCKCWIL